MKPVILFDLDGTLIDSTQAIVEAFFYALDVNQTPRPKEEEITAHVGHTLEDIFQALGVDLLDVDRFVGDYKSRYRTIATQKTDLLPLARETIVCAKNFAILGVVTTKTGRYSKELLEFFDFLHHFDVVIGREDVISPKPDKEPIIKALEAMQKDSLEEKNSVWMIGDTILDLQAARAAGVNSTGVSCGYGDPQDFPDYTPHVAVNAYEAVKMIEKMFSL